ncbi:MAG: hypothetical protein HY361_03865 [Candidatus Aenigmarchaeota archaeon]|nr:hypothetical protein [Candidatus Aenigmarchaeota archaeon]
MNKRGLSEVISNTLLVVLALVGVSAIAYLIYPILNEPEPYNVEYYYDILQIVISSVRIDNLNSHIDLNVRRIKGEENLSAFLVVLEDSERKTYVYREEGNMKIFETKSVSFDWSGLGELRKISVIPIFLADGEEIQGNVFDEYDLRGGEEGTIELDCSIDIIPSFLGAEGFGAETIGGRGGRIVFVDNLLDDVNNPPPGSLRYALTEINEPRIIIFRVAGTIFLENRLEMLEEDSYVSVYGQTAPGNGITIATYPIELQGGFHDGIFQYIRVRTGTNEPWRPPTQQELDSCDTPTCADLVQPRFSIKDAFDIRNGAHNIIVDHSSFSWGLDEILSGGGDINNITIQWSIIGEGSMAGHVEPDHSMGSFFASSGNERMSFHHNYYTLLRDRNPKLNSGNISWINNVNYNNALNFIVTPESRAQVGVINFDIINNYFKKGPVTYAAGTVYLIGGSRTSNQNNPPRVYFSGNKVVESDESPVSYYDPLDEFSLVPANIKAIWEPNQRTSFFAVSLFPITIHTAEQARDLVLANAGATLPVRDEVDSRLVQNFFDGTGELAYPAPGGSFDYPDMCPTGNCNYPLDTDSDGIPDFWEDANELDKDDPIDASEVSDLNCYTNIENYIQSLG